MNIINNVPSVDIGQQLRLFKNETRDMSPFARGEAISESTFIRQTHNSFARELDVLQDDLSLKLKHDRDQKKRSAEQAAATRAIKGPKLEPLAPLFASSPCFLLVMSLSKQYLVWSRCRVTIIWCACSKRGRRKKRGSRSMAFICMVMRAIGRLLSPD